MSVFPPGETNSNVPPWTTASSPVEHPASTTTDIATAIIAMAARRRTPTTPAPQRTIATPCLSAYRASAYFVLGSGIHGHDSAVGTDRRRSRSETGRDRKRERHSYRRLLSTYI